jgi:hypothetical protein
MASLREAVRHMACVVQSFKCAVVFVRHRLSSGCSVQWQLLHASVVTASLSIIDPAGQVCVPHHIIGLPWLFAVTCRPVWLQLLRLPHFRELRIVVLIVRETFGI